MLMVQRRYMWRAGWLVTVCTLGKNGLPHGRSMGASYLIHHHEAIRGRTSRALHLSCNLWCQHVCMLCLSHVILRLLVACHGDFFPAECCRQRTGTLNAVHDSALYGYQLVAISLLRAPTAVGSEHR
jgi:hypothetical protein